LNALRIVEHRSKPFRKEGSRDQGSHGGDPDMKRRHGFIPSALNQLESRVVLSRTTQGLSVVVSGLSPRQRVINREQQAFTAEVNQAFQSFSNDYDGARSTYFASILNQSNPSQATTQAFTLYTTQRVSLLAQQLINIFIQSPQGTAKAPGQPYALKQLISKQIIGPQGEAPRGSLARSLLLTIPQPGTSAPTSTLYTLSQDNAIETAQVAVLNGVSIIKDGAFGIQRVQKY
jgi:hypothetical protein